MELLFFFGSLKNSLGVGIVAESRSLQVMIVPLDTVRIQILAVPITDNASLVIAERARGSITLQGRTSIAK